MSIAFGPGRELTKVETMNGTSGKNPLRIAGGWRLNRSGQPGKDGQPTPPITPEQEAAVQYVDLVLTARTFRLETGSMHEAMQALRTCTDKLLINWGLDPAQQATLSRPAVPQNNPAEWVRSFDYPTSALWRGASGIVHFRLDVDETGAIAGCHIQAMTRPAGFDELSCRLIKERAKFAPALDANGKPVRSYYINQVRWVMQY